MSNPTVTVTVPSPPTVTLDMVGPQGPPGPATAAASLNLADYGAVGDGTTDDTAHIQAAINDANGRYNTSGAATRVVGQPGKTYYCTYQATNYAYASNFNANPALVLKSGVVLDGLSLLFPNFTGSPASVCGIGDQGQTAPAADWQIVGCTLNGQAPTSSPGENLHQAIQIGNSTHFVIRNNKITSWQQNPVSTITTSPTSLSVAHGWVDRNYLTLCNGGLRLHGGQDLWVTDNIAWQALNAAYGAAAAPNCITCSGGYTHQGIHITGNAVYDWGIGYDLDGTCTDIVFTGNYNRCPPSGKGNGLQISAGGSLTRAVIANNLFDMSTAATGAFSAGINARAVLTDVTFTANQVTMGAQSQDAINMQAAAGSKRVRVAGNQIDGVTAVANAVIVANNIADLIVADNHIDASAYSGTGLIGIWIQSSCSRVTVDGNNLVNPYIRLDIGCLVKGNTVVNVGTANPAVNCNASGVAVVANNLSSIGHGVLTPGSVTNCTAVGNTITITAGGGNNIIFQGGNSAAVGNILVNNVGGNVFREVGASANLVTDNNFAGTSTNYVSRIAGSTTVVANNIGPPNSAAILPAHTMHPGLPSANIGFAANQTDYFRNIGGAATITKIGLQVVTAAGNTQVGVYASASPTGPPTTLVASSAQVPTPAAGAATINLTGSVAVDQSNYFAVGTSGASSFIGTGSLVGTSPGALGPGFVYYDSATFPLAATAPAGGGGRGAIVALYGLP